MSKILQTIKDKARKLNKNIVLPESEDSRVVQAAAQSVKEGIARITLLGNADEIKKAIVHAMHLDVTEENLMSQIFDINLNKLSQMNSEDLKNMTHTQIRYIECQLLLKIARKIKLTMMSLEDYLSHDVIVEANFQYDEPQQRIWNEVQNYLNQLSASNGLHQVI